MRKTILAVAVVVMSSFWTTGVFADAAHTSGVAEGVLGTPAYVGCVPDNEFVFLNNGDLIACNMTCLQRFDAVFGKDGWIWGDTRNEVISSFETIRMLEWMAMSEPDIVVSGCLFDALASYEWETACFWSCAIDMYGSLLEPDDYTPCTCGGPFIAAWGGEDDIVISGDGD